MGSSPLFFAPIKDAADCIIHCIFYWCGRQDSNLHAFAEEPKGDVTLVKVLFFTLLGKVIEIGRLRRDCQAVDGECCLYPGDRGVAHNRRNNSAESQEVPLPGKTFTHSPVFLTRPPILRQTAGRPPSPRERAWVRPSNNRCHPERNGV